MSTMALKMPCSYVDIDRDEMEYVDGGASLPNWFVAGAIDTVITFIIGGGIKAFAGYASKMANKYGAQRAGLIFAQELKRKLAAKAVVWRIAGLVGSIAGAAFTVMMWAASPGTAFANWWDSRDDKSNNGYFDF